MPMPYVGFALLGRLSMDHYELSPDERAAEIERLRIDVENNERLYAQQIRSTSGRALAAELATKLTGEPSIDGATGRAFEAFGLDPDDPMNWRTLLEHLASVLFPPALTAGRKREWDGKRYYELLCNVDDFAQRNPNLSRARAFEHIAKKEGLRSRDEIGKRVAALKAAYRKAFDPRQNSWLDWELGRLAAELKLAEGQAAEWKQSFAKRFVEFDLKYRREATDGETSASSVISPKSNPNDG